MHGNTTLLVKFLGFLNLVTDLSYQPKTQMLNILKSFEASILNK